MTIKQQGGIFGRNPTFNNVEVDGSISGDGQIDFSTGPTVTEGAILKEHSLLLFTDQETAGASSNIKGVEIASPTTTRMIFHSTNAGGRKYGLYTSTNGEFALYDYTAGATRWEVNSAGNLAFPAGNGIDFSATSGTGTSELFDDYEEGSYTGTLTPTTSGSITVNAAAQTMNYTKIGRVVFISGFLEVGSASSPVGNDVLLNLPFTVSSLLQDSSRMSSSIYVDNTLVPVRVFNGNTSAYIRRDASLITTGDQFYVSFNYIAA